MKIIFRFHLFKFYILKGRVYCSLLESNCFFSDSVVWLLWYYTLQKKAPCYWNFTASGSQVAPGFDSVTFILKSFFISSLKRESKFRWMYLTFWGTFTCPLEYLEFLSHLDFCLYLLVDDQWKLQKTANDIERSAYCKQYLKPFYYKRYMLHGSKSYIFTPERNRILHLKHKSLQSMFLVLSFFFCLAAFTKVVLILLENTALLLFPKHCSELLL